MKCGSDSLLDPQSCSEGSDPPLWSGSHSSSCEDLRTTMMMMMRLLMMVIKIMMMMVDDDDGDNDGDDDDG